MTRIPLMGIAAHASGQGKTRLTLSLLDEFARRGLKVAVLKHAQHLDLPQDKDSSLFMAHGASAALAVAPTGWLLNAVPEAEPDLAQALELLSNSCQADLLLTEGYKSGPQPKLLLAGQTLKAEQLLPHTLALISDALQTLPLPCFSPEDSVGIANFIMQVVRKQGGV